MSGNPYKKYDNISESEKNSILVEEIIKMLSNGIDVKTASKEFNEKIVWYNERDKDAKQYAACYIAWKTKCTGFKELNE